MELTTDVLLRGATWAQTIDGLSAIFKTRTNYSIFTLCITIGIMYDQRIERFEDKPDEEPRNVPRNVIQNNDNGRMDFMFQAAVLSTRTLELDEEERLDLAFGERQDFSRLGTDSKIAFLTSFANFGVTKLAELIGDTPIESMENIKKFLVSSIEGYNFDLDGISDDVWLEDFTVY